MNAADNNSGDGQNPIIPNVLYWNDLRDIEQILVNRMQSSAKVKQARDLHRQFEHLGTKHCEIDSHEHEWSNYFKCGYKGVLDSVGYCTPKSIQIMMDGTVPAGGGLSSSSAFVCCSALITMLAHNLEMDKGQLTKTAISGEQFAGVAIGGIFY